MIDFADKQFQVDSLCLNSCFKKLVDVDIVFQ